MAESSRFHWRLVDIARVTRRLQRPDRGLLEGAPPARRGAGIGAGGDEPNPPLYACGWRGTRRVPGDSPRSPRCRDRRSPYAPHRSPAHDEACARRVRWRSEHQAAPRSARRGARRPRRPSPRRRRVCGTAAPIIDESRLTGVTPRVTVAETGGRAGDSIVATQRPPRIL